MLLKSLTSYNCKTLPERRKMHYKSLLDYLQIIGVIVTVTKCLEVEGAESAQRK